MGGDRRAARGITRQSAHERYKAAVDEWQLSLVEPYEQAAPGYRPARIHEAALEPTRTGQQLDEWARAHVPAARDDEHPVTGHLPRLSTAEEMVQVLDESCGSCKARSVAASAFEAGGAPDRWALSDCPARVGAWRSGRR
ncbi:hypothetical protein AA958_32590 [Streptomyces sp. CNQ-509]|uniref:hypothetical protein n=1 Tax=Streptomyces sp. CNQ-509 TaxID=444103 RepID=UPI00062DDF1E|nr:hypothetical protein [Streptomyces sp. CNQ-509]AKH86175.1 hypothetical protein AA958_32590 [Streptomyces sp. CNQ-509]